MNHYSFPVRDYLGTTQHLSTFEDLVYRRMLDRYFQTEKPLPLDASKIARLIRLPEQVEAVEAVLAEFFEQTDDGWLNKYCDSEIRRCHQFRDSRAKAASPERSSGKGV